MQTLSTINNVELPKPQQKKQKTDTKPNKILPFNNITQKISKLKPTHPTNTPNKNKHKVIELTTHREANEAMQKAIHSRIKLLPNILERKQTIGKSKTQPKPKGLMWPTKYALQHNAAPALTEYATYGCPVNCGEDWTAEQINTALKYGAHPSAKVPEAL